MLIFTKAIDVLSDTDRSGDLKRSFLRSKKYLFRISNAFSKSTQSVNFDKTKTLL